MVPFPGQAISPANWDTFRRQIPAGLSFGMSGFPYWTTDIGGFFRPADQYTSADYHELLIRWFQFGAFCPIFRIHGYRSETEMWKYGPEVEKILTQYDESALSPSPLHLLDGVGHL